MPYDPSIHHRRSRRLQGYDYSQAGAYFITLCTHKRELLFGTVVQECMQLNSYGQIVRDVWEWLPSQYAYVQLDEFVIMPDHLHAILVIAPLTNEKRKPLGGLIGAFKTVSTKQINSLRNTPGAVVWQRNYYEHIVRDERALQQIRTYIAANPAQWEMW